MTCMTQFEQPMAMATTRLTCVMHEHKSLRMSWVVVTDERGGGTSACGWVSVEDC
jgi:hypothetical protein